MRAWVVALLDPEPIEKGTRGTEGLLISTPPKFTLPKKYQNNPMDGKSTVRGRKSTASPTKASETPSERKIASPRKRQPKKASTAEATPAKDASGALKRALENGEETVRVEVDEAVEQDGDVETVHTTVRVEMPAGHPDLPLPESAEEMVAKARKMVEEARELDGTAGRPASAKGKRKASAIESDADGTLVPASKKARVLEEQIKRQKVRTRALIGIASTLAVGAIIPYFV